VSTAGAASEVKETCPIIEDGRRFEPARDSGSPVILYNVLVKIMMVTKLLIIIIVTAARKKKRNQKSTTALISFRAMAHF